MRWFLLLLALTGFGCVGTLRLGDDDDSAGDDDDAGDDDAGDDDAGDDDAGDDDATGPSPFEGTHSGGLYLYRPAGGGGDKVLFCEGEVQGDVAADGAIEIFGGCRTPNGNSFEIVVQGEVQPDGSLDGAEALMVLGNDPDQDLRYEAWGDFVEADTFVGGFEGEFLRGNGQVTQFIASIELG
jgi:hypothetical protein